MISRTYLTKMTFITLALFAVGCADDGSDSDGEPDGFTSEPDGFANPDPEPEQQPDPQPGPQPDVQPDPQPGPQPTPTPDPEPDEMTRTECALTCGTFYGCELFNEEELPLTDCIDSCLRDLSDEERGCFANVETCTDVISICLPSDDCRDHCATILDNCGGLSTFESEEDCFVACNTYGDDGLPGDDAGDTLQCRQTYAERAANDPANCEDATPASPSCGGPCADFVGTLLAEPSCGPSPMTVTFTAEGSVSGFENVRNIRWEFGDGNSASGQPNVTHVYGAPGDYLATFSFTGDTGNQRADISLEDLRVRVHE